MNRIVLDASALLALLQKEAGGDAVLSAIEDVDTTIEMSAVSFSEVVARLVREGFSSAEVSESVHPFRWYVVEFDIVQAQEAGELHRRTRTAGLSLGDRACLALALVRSATVWTADSIWKTLDLGVKVEVIR